MISLSPWAALLPSWTASGRYRPEHWSVGLWVLRHLKGTCSLRLVHGSMTTTALSGFCDSDYANRQDTSRSIPGYCFKLGSGVISWHSKKHDHASDLSCYAEYIALHTGTQEVIESSSMNYSKACESSRSMMTDVPPRGYTATTRQPPDCHRKAYGTRTRNISAPSTIPYAIMYKMASCKAASRSNPLRG